MASSTSERPGRHKASRTWAIRRTGPGASRLPYSELYLIVPLTKWRARPGPSRSPYGKPDLIVRSPNGKPDLGRPVHHMASWTWAVPLAIWQVGPGPSCSSYGELLDTALRCSDEFYFGTFSEVILRKFLESIDPRRWFQDDSFRPQHNPRSRSLMQKGSSFCWESILLTKSHISVVACWYRSSIDWFYWIGVDRCFLRQALASWLIGSLFLTKSVVACF